MAMPQDENELLEFIRTNGLGRVETAVRGIQSALGARGTATVTWPGAGSLSNQVSVAHGLKYAPTHVLVTVFTSGQGEVIAAHGDADATNVRIQAEWVKGFVPGGGSAVVTWWAW